MVKGGNKDELVARIADAMVWFPLAPSSAEVSAGARPPTPLPEVLRRLSALPERRVQVPRPC
jgi:hypothetical protein